VTTIDAVVAVVALALAAWELWYFRGRRRGAAAGQPKASAQEYRIVLQGGFRPDLVIAEAGRQVRLEILRCEVDPETEQLEFDNLKVTKSLTEFSPSLVEFIPGEPGDYRFRCGTCEGYVVAQVGGEAVRANLGRGHQKHG
jgi:plastocyanin domain-containing protein